MAWDDDGESWTMDEEARAEPYRITTSSEASCRDVALTALRDIARSPSAEDGIRLEAARLLLEEGSS